MIIETPEVTRTVDDFDITFHSGMLLPITVDKEAGDTIVFEPDAIRIDLVAKLSPTDPNKTLIAEDLLIYTKDVAVVQHRKRVITEPTIEQKVEWLRTVKELGGVQ